MNIRSVSAPRKICAVFATAVLLPVIAHATQTWWMRGGNWADGRDNYVDGWIIPSGLTASSSATAAASKASQIASDIKGITDNNGRVVRMGIPDRLITHGEAKLLLAKYGLDADGIYTRVRENIEVLDDRRLATKGTRKN